jgi:hypothetical protein
MLHLISVRSSMNCEYNMQRSLQEQQTVQMRLASTCGASKVERERKRGREKENLGTPSVFSVPRDGKALLAFSPCIREPIMMSHRVCPKLEKGARMQL